MVPFYIIKKIQKTLGRLQYAYIYNIKVKVYFFLTHAIKALKIRQLFFFCLVTVRMVRMNGFSFFRDKVCGYEIRHFPVVLPLPIATKERQRILFFGKEAIECPEQTASLLFFATFAD